MHGQISTLIMTWLHKCEQTDCNLPASNCAALMKRSLTLLLVCGETSGHFSWGGPNGLEAPLDGEEFVLLSNRWEHSRRLNVSSKCFNINILLGCCRCLCCTSTVSLTYSCLMYPTPTCHCIHSCPCQLLTHFCIFLHLIQIVQQYSYSSVVLYTRRTCTSQWAHLRFGSLCCLHRSFCLHHWKGRGLQAYALCLLWKKKRKTQ